MNLLVLPWFVNPGYTYASPVENLKIQIPGTQAIPTKFESQSEMGKYILLHKLFMNHSGLKPLVYTLDLTTRVYDFLQG